MKLLMSLFSNNVVYLIIALILVIGVILAITLPFLLTSKSPPAKTTDKTVTSVEKFERNASVAREDIIDEDKSGNPWWSSQKGIPVPDGEMNENYEEVNGKSQVVLDAMKAFNDYAPDTKSTISMVNTKKKEEDGINGKSQAVLDAAKAFSDYAPDIGGALNKATMDRKKTTPYQPGASKSFNKQNEERESSSLKSKKGVVRVGLGLIGPNVTSQQTGFLDMPKLYDSEYLYELDGQKPHTEMGRAYSAFSYNDVTPSEYHSAMFDMISNTTQTKAGTKTRYGELLDTIKDLESSDNPMDYLKNIVYPEFIVDSPMISSKHVSVYLSRLLQSNVNNRTVADFYNFLVEKKALNINVAVTMLKYLVKSNVADSEGVNKLLAVYNKPEERVSILVYALNSPKYLSTLMPREQAISYANLNLNQSQKDMMMSSYLSDKRYNKLVDELKKFRQENVLSANIDDVKQLVGGLQILSVTKRKILSELEEKRENFFLPSGLGGCFTDANGHVTGNCSDGIRGQ